MNEENFLRNESITASEVMGLIEDAYKCVVKGLDESIIHTHEEVTAKVDGFNIVVNGNTHESIRSKYVVTVSEEGYEVVVGVLGKFESLYFYSK